jgi:chitosanase
MRFSFLIVVGLLGISPHLQSSAAAQDSDQPATKKPQGLYVPAKKDIAMQLVSTAENSSLDWKAQYGYIEYNVEGNEDENRGYTAGIVGFTSRTHDMLELVRYYQKIAPDNVLAPFLPVLKKVDGSPSKEGLGEAFVAAWEKAAEDPKFREAQDFERDRVYFNPSVNQAIKDGLHELGQFIYYDAMVMHGGIDRMRKKALAKAKPPSQGGDETTYLNAFLDERKAEMKREEGHQDTTRVDTMQRKFLKDGNLTLELPLVFKQYGDDYTIEKPKDAK